MLHPIEERKREDPMWTYESEIKESFFPQSFFLPTSEEGETRRDGDTPTHPRRKATKGTLICVRK